jgi:FMN-dependent NADH-azoreductase
VPGERPAAWEAGQRVYVDELLAADVVLVAVPMYNYSMPSTLKAWLDHVHLPGVTAGPVQPLAGRAAVLVSARGAEYGTDASPEVWDHGTESVAVVLGESMGMRIERIVQHLTLAGALPAFGDRLEQGEASRRAALERARRLAAELG